MAIKKYYKYGFLTFILLFIFFIIGSPQNTCAATLTKTTVYVNINKSSILGHSFETGLQNKFIVTITKGSNSYSTTAGADKDGYIKYSKSIVRCSPPTTDQSGWTIKIVSTAPNILYSKTIPSATLCGDPIYTIKANGTLYKDAGRACTACPSTDPAGPQGPLLSVTGVLKRITGAGLPAEDKIYYIDSTSGDNLSFGTSLNETLTPPAVWTVGATYTCNYMEPRSNPTRVDCSLGITPPPQTPTPANPANPADPAADPADDGTPAATPKEPVAVKIGETVTLDEGISKTKGCGTDGKYTTGILKGVSCSGATKTKEELVQIVKNIIEGFLIPIVGVLFVTILIVGGLVYITSGGSEESVKKAKKILTSGIIGLLIVILSYTLIRIFVSILGGGIV